MSQSNGGDNQKAGKNSYEKLLKSLQHTQAEKSLMLQEIQHLKSQLRKLSSSMDSPSSASKKSDDGSPRAHHNHNHDDDTVDRLLESNLKFGMMATMWSIKSCLNKRIHRAFCHWRTVSQQLRLDEQFGDRISDLVIKHDQEMDEMLNQPTDDAWQRTAMSLLMVQKKQERSPSQNSRAMSVNSAPAGAHSAGRGRGYGKSHIRARSANSDGGYSAQKRVGGAGAKSPYNMFGTFQRGGQQERGRGRSPPHAHPRSAIKPQSSPHKPHFMRNTTSSKQHYSGHSGRFQYDALHNDTHMDRHYADHDLVHSGKMGYVEEGAKTAGSYASSHKHHIPEHTRRASMKQNHSQNQNHQNHNQNMKQQVTTNSVKHSSYTNNHDGTRTATSSNEASDDENENVGQNQDHKKRRGELSELDMVRDALEVMKDSSAIMEESRNATDAMIIKGPGGNRGSRRAPRRGGMMVKMDTADLEKEMQEQEQHDKLLERERQQEEEGLPTWANVNGNGNGNGEQQPANTHTQNHSNRADNSPVREYVDRAPALLTEEGHSTGLQIAINDSHSNSSGYGSSSPSHLRPTANTHTSKYGHYRRSHGNDSSSGNNSNNNYDGHRTPDYAVHGGASQPKTAQEYQKHYNQMAAYRRDVRRAHSPPRGRNSPSGNSNTSYYGQYSGHYHAHSADNSVSSGTYRRTSSSITSAHNNYGTPRHASASRGRSGSRGRGGTAPKTRSSSAGASYLQPTRSSIKKVANTAIAQKIQEQYRFQYDKSHSHFIGQNTHSSKHSSQYGGEYHSPESSGGALSRKHSPTKTGTGGTEYSLMQDGISITDADLLDAGRALIENAANEHDKDLDGSLLQSLASTGNDDLDMMNMELEHGMSAEELLVHARSIGQADRHLLGQFGPSREERAAIKGGVGSSIDDNNDDDDDLPSWAKGSGSSPSKDFKGKEEKKKKSKGILSTIKSAFGGGTKDEDEDEEDEDDSALYAQEHDKEQKQLKSLHKHITKHDTHHEHLVDEQHTSTASASANSSGTNNNNSNAAQLSEESAAALREIDSIIRGQGDVEDTADAVAPHVTLDECNSLLDEALAGDEVPSWVKPANPIQSPPVELATTGDNDDNDNGGGGDDDVPSWAKVGTTGSSPSNNGHEHGHGNGAAKLSVQARMAMIANENGVKLGDVETTESEEQMGARMAIEMRMAQLAADNGVEGFKSSEHVK